MFLRLDLLPHSCVRASEVRSARAAGARVRLNDQRPDEMDVFVYGTLMPGQVRWDTIAPYVRESSNASVPGRLLDTGYGYPGLVREGSGTVRGHLLRLRHNRQRDALRLLDEIEGTRSGLYRRLVVHTTDGRPAWTYEYLHPEPQMQVLAGDWTLR